MVFLLKVGLIRSPLSSSLYINLFQIRKSLSVTTSEEDTSRVTRRSSGKERFGECFTTFERSADTNSPHLRVFLATDIASLNEFSESDRSEPTPSDDELIDDEASEDRGVEEFSLWVVKRRWSIFAGDIANTVICSEPTIRYERMVKYVSKTRSKTVASTLFYNEDYKRSKYIRSR